MKCFTLILIAALFTACAQEKKPDASQSLRVNKRDTVPSSSALADCTLKLKTSQLCLSYYWEKIPTENEEGSIVFKVFHASKLDQTVVMNALPETPDVFLWMPSMGHGSTPMHLDFIDTGTYRATKAYFMMPGAWEIHFKIKTAEAGLDELVVPVTY